MSWAAIGVSVAGAVVSGGISYGLSQASQPKSPDLASSSKQMSDVNAQLLPFLRSMEAAAQQGGKIEVPGEAHLEQRDEVFVDGTWQPYKPGDWAQGGKYFGKGQTGKGGSPTRRTTPVMVPGTPHTIDFKGMGTADVQSTIAKKMAELQLRLSQKYDGQFIDEALKQAKLADPQGFAARDKMHDLIQEQINAKPDRPVAELLDKQIAEELHAAQSGHLDPAMKAMLDKNVEASLAARGGNGPAGDFEQPLVTGFAGEERQRNAAQKSMGWLTSGATPEDIEYRREQQNMSNLSAEVNGRTPESQFSSLSAVQQGPTPTHLGQPLPTFNPNSANQGAQNAITNYGQQVSNANNNVSGWMTGLNGILGGVQTYAAAKK